jgi:hypothetical protein
VLLGARLGGFAGGDKFRGKSLGKRGPL